MTAWLYIIYQINGHEIDLSFVNMWLQSAKLSVVVSDNSHTSSLMIYYRKISDCKMLQLVNQI